jgi:hypothetical protein
MYMHTHVASEAFPSSDTLPFALRRAFPMPEVVLPWTAPCLTLRSVEGRITDDAILQTEYGRTVVVGLENPIVARFEHALHGDAHQQRLVL